MDPTCVEGGQAAVVHDQGYREWGRHRHEVPQRLRDGQVDEEVLNEDGVPNTSIDMNSSIERDDPFGDDDVDMAKDQDKKSE